MLVRLLIALLLSSLSGCGMHLYESKPKQPTFAEQYHTVLIDTPAPYSRFSKHLTRTLTANGVKVTHDRSQADAVLRVYRLNKREFLSAVSSNSQNGRYATRLIFQYELMGKQGDSITGKQKIVANRPYTSTQSQILGANEERWLVEQSLQTDVVEQLMNRLNHMRPKEIH